MESVTVAHCLTDENPDARAMIARAFFCAQNGPLEFQLWLAGRPAPKSQVEV
jgi:hypothetical protein